MQRNFQIFFRPNPNTASIPINNLEDLETYVRLLSITVLGLEGDQLFNLTSVPGESKILNPLQNDVPFTNIESLRYVIGFKPNQNTVTLYPIESKV